MLCCRLPSVCVSHLPCPTSSLTHLTLDRPTLLVRDQRSQLSALLADIVESVNTKRTFKASPSLGLACSCVISESSLHVLCCAGTKALSHPFLLFSFKAYPVTLRKEVSLYSTKNVVGSRNFHS